MIQPLRLNIPAEIRTERLLLRCPRVGEGAFVFANVRASLAELKPWMPWATDEYDVDGANDWCARAASEFITRETASYFVCDPTDGRHMGTVTAFVKNWKIPKLEIGYWLVTSEVGRGFMTEAVRAVTKMAFDAYGARRIEIHTDVDNLRSAKVAERADYTLDGILKNECRDEHGNLRDTRLYSQTR